MTCQVKSSPDRIFEFWVWCMQKNPKVTKFAPERRRKIQARLRQGYTLENIIQAICGCSGSAWHMGDNSDCTKYDDLTLICRNGSKLERFMGMTTTEAASETYRRFEKETGIEGEGDFPKLVHSAGNEGVDESGA